MTPFFQLAVLHPDTVARAHHEQGGCPESPRDTGHTDHSPDPTTGARRAGTHPEPVDRRESPDARPRTIAQAMAELRSLGLKVAVVGASDDTIGRLHDLGWHPDDRSDTRVDAVIADDEVPAGPPAPHQIHAAMARTGVPDVHRVIAVGTHIAEMRAGRNSGGVVVGLLTGDADSSELLEAGADEVLDSLTDLPHWVSRARVRPPLPAA